MSKSKVHRMVCIRCGIKKEVNIKEKLCLDCMAITSSYMTKECERCGKEFNIILRKGFKYLKHPHTRKVCKDCKPIHKQRSKSTDQLIRNNYKSKKVEHHCVICGDKFMGGENRFTCSSVCCDIFRKLHNKIKLWNLYHYQIYTGVPHERFTPSHYKYLEKLRNLNKLK